MEEKRGSEGKKGKERRGREAGVRGGVEWKEGGKTKGKWEEKGRVVEGKKGKIRSKGK